MDPRSCVKAFFPTKGPSYQVQFQGLVYLIFTMVSQEGSLSPRWPALIYHVINCLWDRPHTERCQACFHHLATQCMLTFSKGLLNWYWLSAGQEIKQLWVAAGSSGFHRKTPKPPKGFQGKRGCRYWASEALHFPWDQERDGSHVCPHINTAATHRASWAAARVESPGMHFLVAASG